MSGNPIRNSRARRATVAALGVLVCASTVRADLVTFRQIEEVNRAGHPIFQSSGENTQQCRTSVDANDVNDLIRHRFVRHEIPFLIKEDVNLRPIKPDRVVAT